MACDKLMKKLLISYGWGERFRAVTEQIILEEKQKNNRVLVRSLCRTFNDVTSANVRSSEQPPSQKLASLVSFPDAVSDSVERVEPVHSYKGITLSYVNTRVFDGLLQRCRRSEETRRHGLAVRVKPLFYDPPGCSKTLRAEVFTAELGLPLFVAELDCLILSYLGGTVGNVRKIFEFVGWQPCVLLPDELNALTCSHDDSAEYDELRRVVNSLLLFIDHMQPHSFMIAMINLDGSLDPMIWR